MRKISWQSWNIDEQEQIEIGDNIDESEEYNSYEMNMMSANEQLGALFPPEQNFIITPFGLYSPQNPFTPSKRWDCWIGYTNFDIGVDVVNIIKRIPGVESLCVMGRYTFCIGIPKHGDLFNSQETKLLIQESLCGETDIEVIRDKIAKQKHWAVLMRADGYYHCAYSKRKDNEYKKQLDKLNLLQQNYGGVIYDSETNSNI